MEPGPERKSRFEATIALLTRSSGSDESISRGRYIALGIAVIGMVGAVGSALRPVYSSHFRRASNQVVRSAAAAQREAQGSMSSADAERLEKARQRLAELQAKQQLRHPALRSLDDSRSP